VPWLIACLGIELLGEISVCAASHIISSAAHPVFRRRRFFRGTVLPFSDRPMLMPNAVTEVESRSLVVLRRVI